MLNGGAQRYRDEIASLIGWWAEAGVTSFADENRRDWLAPPAPKVAPSQAPPAAAPPADLAAFRAMLASNAYLPGAPPPQRRVAAEGEAGARLMIVTDMPDEADLRARRLLSAESALFDAMLAAMGLTRASVYLAPLSPGRITGGRIGAAADGLAALMRAHIGLARPSALLLFGEETCRALMGVERAEACATLRSVNYDGGTVAAIATIHPRILVRRPACKADAWAAMRQILGVLAQ
ncbi:uracil-DNA glycosylase [Sphingomonas sp.]|uniref:uracil-DNA glycosylase family protein n=1 Tax=Sphingomonas sp. TaxID=28214 RepID=UPI003B0094E6